MNFALLDAETCLISPAQQAPTPVCWVTDVDGRDELLHARFDRDDVLQRLYWAFKARPTGAHIAFDAAVAMAHYPELREVIWEAYDEYRVWDLLHAEKLIDLAHGRLGWRPGPEGMLKSLYNLGDIVERRFGHKMDKGGATGWRMRFGTLLGTRVAQFPTDATEYVLDDVRWPRKLLHTQLQAEPACLVDVARQSRAALWAYLMTCRGFRTDRQWVERFEQSIVTSMEEIKRELVPLGLLDMTGKRNTKAAMTRAAAVCAEKGLKVQMTGEDEEGQVDLSKEACKEIGDPALLRYSQYSGNKTMLAKVGALKDASIVSMPVQSKFEVIVATGRMACQGGRPKKKFDLANRSSFSFQLHNLNRKSDLRGCFIPREGYWLGSLDYGQFELCSWAQVCMDLFGFSKLGEELNRGDDVHCTLGAKLFKLDLAWVIANRKTEPKAKEARQGSKPVNFGAPGLMGPKGMVAYAKTQYDVIFTEEEAAGHLKGWREMRPESKPYFDYVRRCVDRDGYIVQVRSGRVRGSPGASEASNSFFQGLAADAKKQAGCELSRVCYTGRDSFGNYYPALFGSYIVCEIHDEFLFEFPIDRAHEAALEAKGIMEREAAKWMPDVPPKVEPALMERWLKDAEPKYEQGRLVPWRKS